MGTDNSGEPVLSLTGDLDLVTRDCLRGLLDCLLASGSPRTVTLDLTGVGFADCAGLAVLARAQRRLASHGGRLIASGPRPAVRRIISLTGLAEDLNLTG